MTDKPFFCRRNFWVAAADTVHMTDLNRTDRHIHLERSVLAPCIDELRTAVDLPVPDREYYVAAGESVYALDSHAAAELVSQYDAGASVARTTFREVQSPALRATVALLGIDTLVNQLKIGQLLAVDVRGFSAEQLIEMLEKHKIVSRDLFQLQTIARECTQHGLPYQQFVPYLATGIAAGVLPELQLYIHNVAGKSFRYERFGTDDIVQRPLTADDVAGGLLILTSLAEFRRQLENAGGRSYESIAADIPGTRVSTMLDAIVDGQIPVGLEPAGVPPEALAKYDQKANAICLGSLAPTPARPSDSLHGNATPRALGLHETKHALDDQDGRRINNDRAEAEAWSLQSLYELLSSDDATFDAQTSATKETAREIRASIMRLGTIILPPAFVAELLGGLPETFVGIRTHVWAKAAYRVLQGLEPPAILPPLMDAAVEEFRTTEILSGLAQIMGSTAQMPACLNLAQGQNFSLALPAIGTVAEVTIDTGDFEAFHTWYEAGKAGALALTATYEDATWNNPAQAAAQHQQLQAYLGALTAYLIVLGRLEKLVNQLPIEGLATVVHNQARDVMQQFMRVLTSIKVPAGYNARQLGIE